MSYDIPPDKVSIDLFGNTCAGTYTDNRKDQTVSVSSGYGDRSDVKISGINPEITAKMVLREMIQVTKISGKLDGFRS